MTEHDEQKIEYDSPGAKRTYYWCEKCSVYFYEEKKTPNLNLVHLPCGRFVKLIRFEGNWSFEDFTDDRAESVRAEYEDYLHKKRFYKEDEENDDEDWSDLFEI